MLCVASWNGVRLSNCVAASVWTQRTNSLFQWNPRMWIRVWACIIICIAIWMQYALPTICRSWLTNVRYHFCEIKCKFWQLYSCLRENCAHFMWFILCLNIIGMANCANRIIRIFMTNWANKKKKIIGRMIGWKCVTQNDHNQKKVEKSREFNNGKCVFVRIEKKSISNNEWTNWILMLFQKCNGKSQKVMKM